MAAAGQTGFADALGVVAMDAVRDRLAAGEVARSALFAQSLTDMLQLDRMLCAQGMAISTDADVAMQLRTSDYRAGRLLDQARLLAGLPDGLTVLAQGLLTVEQVTVLAAETARLDPAALVTVWDKLLTRLRNAQACGELLPPGRLTSLLRKWALEVAPLDAVKQREKAQDDADLDWRDRPDGLVDLYALGLTRPNAHAVLTRIQAESAPVGPDDRRPAGRRRLDALVDLLTGRIPLPLPGLGVLDDPTGSRGATTSGRVDDPAAGTCCCGTPAARQGCGCASGTPVPCGVQVQVLVPLGAALGTTDEVAELTSVGRLGSAPIDSDLLQRLLLSAPRLRAVWVDEHGVPVATANRTHTPRRNDPADVRAQLLALAGQRPPPPEPRHPDDHHPDDHHPDDHHPDDHLPGHHPPGHDDPAEAGRDAAPPRPGADTGWAAELSDAIRRSTAGPHPPGTPGPYRVPGRLRRLLALRRPLCEWPGCGMPARRCDLEHDLPWPAGPTCGCNLGPCCRRHHRIKQLGWTKQRTGTAVVWTSPTGRSWTSPSPHQPPRPAVRPLPDLPVSNPMDLLSQTEWENELHPTDPRLDDIGQSTFCDDTEPEQTDDPLAYRLRYTDTRWTLDLADAQAWQDIPHTADR